MQETGKQIRSHHSKQAPETQARRRDERITFFNTSQCKTNWIPASKTKTKQTGNGTEYNCCPACVTFMFRRFLHGETLHGEMALHMLSSTSGCNHFFGHVHAPNLRFRTTVKKSKEKWRNLCSYTYQLQTYHWAGGGPSKLWNFWGGQKAVKRHLALQEASCPLKMSRVLAHQLSLDGSTMEPGMLGGHVNGQEVGGELFLGAQSVDQLWAECGPGAPLTHT